MIEARLDQHLNICRHCDAKIVNASGPDGTRLVLDAHASDHGNLALTVMPKGLAARPVSRGQAEGMRSGGVATYQDHALSCPKTDVWHRRDVHGVPSRKYAKPVRGRR